MGLWLIAGFLAYTRVVLTLASRDLRQRASLVYWESIPRYIAALLLIPAGLFGGLAIGLMYMSGLARELGVTHSALLFDCVD